MIISILGLGLIGGSIAKALRKSNFQIIVNAFDKYDVLSKAKQENVIDNILHSPEDALSSDIIFLCTPLDSALDIFETVAPQLNKNSILTDVCGVKGIFETKWKNIKSRGFYFGGHPMTGKEKGGYENSDPLLFENAVYIISDSANEYPQSDKLIEVIKLLGARIIFLDSFLHDKVVANVSHLPQLLSVALVNNAANCSERVNNLDFAAGGFRDMTRIASSDFTIWNSVIKNNKEQILAALDSLQSELALIKDYLINDSSDNLQQMFESAGEKRERVPKNTKGFMSPLYDVFVYAKDEPGNISKISSALFQQSINIKDIELLKIREGTGGTFRLAFESDKDAEKAKIILNEIGFSTI